MTEPKRHISPSVLRQKADNGRTLMLSPQVLRELADYIEWMQQRIAELEGKRCARHTHQTSRLSEACRPLEPTFGALERGGCG